MLKTKTILINGGLLILALIILFGIMEILFWMTGLSTVAQKNTGSLFEIIEKVERQGNNGYSLNYVLRPNQTSILLGKEVSINSQGLRDIEYPIKKPENIYRICILGDSITFGWGVDMNDTYTEVLEKELNLESSKKIEVINFGVPGYNTIDELYILKEKVLNYSPDIILFGYYLNDPDNQWDPYATSLNLPIPFKKFLDEHSYSYNFFKKKWQNIKTKNDLGRFRSYDKLYEEDSGIWENETKRFREISEISKNENITLLFVIMPEWVNFTDYPYEMELEKTKKALSDEEINFIDILNDSRKLNAADYRLTKEDSTHPNAEGHVLLAHIISQKLSSLVPLKFFSVKQSRDNF